MIMKRKVPFFGRNLNGGLALLWILWCNSTSRTLSINIVILSTFASHSLMKKLTMSLELPYDKAPGPDGFNNLFSKDLSQSSEGIFISCVMIFITVDDC
jgi:hypothetical protein